MKAEKLFEELKRLEEKTNNIFFTMVALRDFDFTANLLDNAEDIEEDDLWNAITDVGAANELPILLVCPKNCYIPFDVYILKVTESEIITRCLEVNDEYRISFNEIADTWMKIDLVSQMEKL